jgi:putative SbcD/Mre11-related phosphoesterase
MRVLNDWELTPDRAAVHLPTRTAVVADLHLGYAEARQRDGDAVPAMPVAKILAPLRRAFGAHRVRQLVIAGDLFEAGPSPTIVDELLTWLMDAAVDLAAVVPGNHDGDIKNKGCLPVQPDGFDLGGWRVVHGDGARPTSRAVQGHEHPIMRWGNGLTAPCYLVGRDHLVLPAFSPDAAGANVLGGTDWSAYRCCAIAGSEVLDFGKLADLRPKR